MPAGSSPDRPPRASSPSARVKVSAVEGKGGPTPPPVDAYLLRAEADAIRMEVPRSYEPGTDLDLTVTSPDGSARITGRVREVEAFCDRFRVTVTPLGPVDDLLRLLARGAPAPAPAPGLLDGAAVPRRPIRVLVVDDSLMMRKALRRLLEADDIIIAGEAKNGQEGIDLVRSLDPDLVTLDIEMPKMDGLAALRRIMTESPRPVIMISALTTEGAEATLEALSLGAVDYIPKGHPFKLERILDRREEILDRIRRVCQSPLFPRPAGTPFRSETPSAKAAGFPASARRVEIVAIGASTGGPSAVQAVLDPLPEGFPAAILIAQHMPEAFTPSFSERLNRLLQIEVREAKDQDEIRPGLCLIGRGGHHLEVAGGNRIRVFRDQEDDPWFYVPSADILLKSVARHYGDRACGVILTGMGSDGSKGLMEIREQGGFTIAQDEATSVIYGMPGAAAKTGAARCSLPLSQIGPSLLRLVGL